MRRRSEAEGEDDDDERNVDEKKDAEGARVGEARGVRRFEVGPSVGDLIAAVE